MDLDRHVCDRARLSRDARFDGRFFIGVTSTRVYCRPICPARAPKDEHVRYFPSAAAAEAAGFRPCLRCRPEASPGTPAWLGTSALVSRALRLIGEGELRGGGPGVKNDQRSVETLADRLGVTGRHLRRLFLQHLGATPLEVALTRRVHFAKKLLDETTLVMSDVAFASGFGSLRRFNAQIRRTYSRTPTELRRLARRRAVAEPDCYRFRLAYRPPYDWDAMLTFLAARAAPGVESVNDTIRALARRVVNGTVTFRSCRDGRAAVSALEDLPGIGNWTAEYIAMRALGEPDAFPSGDLVLRRAAGDCTARALSHKSEAWRPWRAYAVMLLWQDANDRRDKSWRTRHAQSAGRSTLGERPRRVDRAVVPAGAE